MTRGETRNCTDERRVHDRHRRSNSYDVVQLNDVGGAHSNASVACWRSDFPFFRRAVDVNISAECVGILCFESTQPENTCHDWVAAGRIRQHSFAGASAVFKYGAWRRAIANFFCDRKLAQRRIPAASPITKSKLRRGDWVDRHQIAAIEKGQFLIARADDDLMLGVGCCAGCEEQSNKKEVIA